MISLFRILLRTSPRALFILFGIILFASTGVLTISNIISNVTVLVAREARPFLGADLAVKAGPGFTGSLREIVTPRLGAETELILADKVTLNTTLFDSAGKAVLVKVVAVDASYPMYSTYETTRLEGGSGTGTIVAATPNLITRLGRILKIDGQEIRVQSQIDKTSELGIGFGDEGFLLIVSRELLDKTALFTRGARLERQLLIRTGGDEQTDRLYKALTPLEAQFGRRAIDVDSYLTNASRTNEIIGELGKYTLLILLVSAFLGAITLYSSLSKYLTILTPTLRTLEILGMRKSRQLGAIVFVILVTAILGFAGAIWLGWGIIEILRQIPETSEFALLVDPIVSTAIVMIILLVSVTLPELIGVFAPEFGRGLRPPFGAYVRPAIQYGVYTLGILGVLAHTLWDLTDSLLALGLGVLIIALLSWIFGLIYRGVFWFLGRTSLRAKSFGMFDGVRSLVRPRMPAASLTVTLVCSLALLSIFLTMTLIFRERLQVSSSPDVNLFATNILESDIIKIRTKYSEENIYSILRGRIINVNSTPLAKHLGSGKPSGEFTREFSITTSPLQNAKILEGSTLTSDGVSVMADFAERLQVKRGDTIVFSIAGREFPLVIQNLREGAQGRIEPFFYFQVLPGAFDSAPKTYFLGVNSSDVDREKQRISSLSGPHVVYVDTRAVLEQVRAISDRILGILWLFLGFVTVFAVLTVLTLFEGLRPIYSLKARLYELLGAERSLMRASLLSPLALVVGFSVFVALVLSAGGLLFVLTKTRLLTWSNELFGMSGSLVLLLATALGAYVLISLIFPILRKRRD